MSTIGIRDPRIANAFQTLGNAMFPSAMDTVRASVLGAQREMLQSRAGLYGAQTADVNMDMEGRRRMSDIIAQNGVDFSQQHNRGQMMAGAMLRSNAPQAVAGAAGAVGVVNPNMPDLSRILTAGGVQTYQNTPQGFAEANTRMLEQAAAANASNERIAAAGNASRERIAAMPPPAGAAGADAARSSVSPMDVGRLNEMVAAALIRRYNEQNRTTLGPEALVLEQDLQARVAADAEREFRQSGLPQAAVNAALAGLPIDFSDNRGWIRGADRVTARLRAGGANPTPSGGGGTGAAGAARAAPAAGAAQTPAVSPEGTVIRGPAGQMLVKRSGQWEPVQ